jgi:hypothetical protein
VLQARALELALATAEAKLDAQHAIMAQWRIPSSTEETPMKERNNPA